MISQTDINNACDMKLLAMGAYVAGDQFTNTLSVPTGFDWWSCDSTVCSNYWSEYLWWLIKEAINEQPSGAMPHNVYAMIAPKLSIVSGCDQAGNESDSAFFKRALIAIAYPSA